jgi:hypothetical protein
MSVSLLAHDVISLIDKYMYMTRDFAGKFIKAPSKSKMYECYYYFRVCDKSQKAVQKLFNIKAPYFVICVDHGEDFRRAYYIINDKAKVRATDIKVVEFTVAEANKVKAICAYKETFNGRGQDPKCSS